MNRKPLISAVVLALAAATAGCESTGPRGDASLALSFAVASDAGLAATLAGALDPITDGTHTLDLQQVFVQTSSVEVEYSGPDGTASDSDTDSDSDSDSDGGHDEHITFGGSTIELPLEGGIVTPVTGTVPAGSYKELELDIEALRLVGTYDGEAFDVTVPIDMDLELELEPPLILAEGDPFNVTVNVAVADWFRSNGTVVDPRDFATDSNAQAAFRQRVALAFEAFGDQDRDADEADSDSDSR